MYLIITLGVFFVVDVLLIFFRPTDVWSVRLVQGLLGIGGVMAYDGLGHWYLGFGVAGGAILLHRLADLLLVLANPPDRR